MRNVANYSPPIIELTGDEAHEWETILRLAAVVAGQGASPAAAATLDDFALLSVVQKAVTRRGSPIEGRDAGELIDELSANGRRGPERMLDFMLRTGPYGDQFGAARPRGRSVAREARGEPARRRPRSAPTPPPDALAYAERAMIELAPEAIVADVEARLIPSLDRRANGEMVLVGRRDLRSNNSWMHNLKVLVKGKPRCTLQIHPDDASGLV